MRIYAQTPVARGRQLATDLFLLAWCVVWIAVARWVYDLVLALAAPGRSVENAGIDLSRSMLDAADAAGSVPLAGDALAAPFELAADVGARLQDAGRAQQEAVATLAFWLAVVLAAIPIAWAVFRLVPARLRWIREAAAAQRVLYDVDLFALRALQRRSLRELAAVGSAPAEGWRRGDPQTIARLAALELRSLGLHPPRAATPGRPTRGGAATTPPG